MWLQHCWHVLSTTGLLVPRSALLLMYFRAGHVVWGGGHFEVPSRRHSRRTRRRRSREQQERKLSCTRRCTHEAICRPASWTPRWEVSNIPSYGNAYTAVLEHGKAQRLGTPSCLSLPNTTDSGTTDSWHPRKHALLHSTEVNHVYFGERTHNSPAHQACQLSAAYIAKYCMLDE